MNEQAISRYYYFGNNKKIIKVEKISGKYDILTVEEKRVTLIGNNKKRSIEITPWKRVTESIRLKTARLHINKRTKIEK